MPKIRDSKMAIRDIVRRRARGLCECCGAKPTRNPGAKTRGTIHHRMPRRIQGPDSVENLVLLCFPCHRAIHQDEASAFDVGFIVNSNPGAEPILHSEHGMVYLLSTGDVATSLTESVA